MTDVYLLNKEIMFLLASEMISHITRGELVSRCCNPLSMRSLSILELCLSTSLESPTSMCIMALVLESINTAVDLLAQNPESIIMETFVFGFKILSFGINLIKKY